MEICKEVLFYERENQENLEFTNTKSNGEVHDEETSSVPWCPFVSSPPLISLSHINHNITQ